jgi:hypothetical protein
MTKKLLLWATFIMIYFYLTGCGTLGGIGYGVYFPLPKEKVRQAFDSLFVENPEYKIPTKWKIYDDWSQRGYDFLESEIIYFKSQPEEMYYVTFIDDGLYASKNKTGIGIQAVFIEESNWMTNKNLSIEERKRIEKRFEGEIVSKLEKYSKCKTWKQ